MLRETLCLLLLGGLASSITCPDGKFCPDVNSCCRTKQGYNCCPYPRAVCCSDLAHCCPEGYTCNLATMMCEKVGQPWRRIPMVRREEAAAPLQPLAPSVELQNSLEESKSSVVYCDNVHYCPDGTTCCRHPKGPWFCCPIPSARCCTDGIHCCPRGYDCDLTYKHCVRQGLRYPFLDKQALSSFPALSSPAEKKISEEEPLDSIPMVLTEEAAAPLQPLAPSVELQNSLEESKSSVVYCDHVYYCPDGTTCCRHPKGPWFCCPIPSARCCTDGIHCCPYGYDCDLTYTHCVRQGLRYPFPERQALSSFPALSSPAEEKTSLEEKPLVALTEAVDATEEAAVIRCDSKFYCPAGKSCCRGARGQWSCCPYKLGKCCADGMHCCEYGYTCSPTSTSCTKQSAQIL
ncbi:progranulin-like [Nelusetta ayraudi]|uniref:progranulin-like n=1 Tax=Nelusetta ayraudi TaxID=303726 RepID=UPI003F6E6ED6